MKGIFYNSQKSLCSIYSSGIMCYDVLKNSTLYTLFYSEKQGGGIDYTSDFIVVNYHPVVCKWIKETDLKTYKGKTFCIVTEVGLYTNDVAPVTPKIFDHYIIIDPTVKEKNNIHAFPRPLIECIVPPYIPKTIPIIGSFGFATEGKNWGQIIEKVFHEFDEAIIRFNIPKATHVPNSIYNKIINEIKSASRILRCKPKIKFELTFHSFQTQQDIVNWCAQNTINIFLYNRPHVTGLCAVTDQAILSERPLLVSNHATFRHIHPYLQCSPNITIKKAIETTQQGVLCMKNDWSSKNFLNKFERILQNLI